MFSDVVPCLFVAFVAIYIINTISNIIYKRNNPPLYIPSYNYSGPPYIEGRYLSKKQYERMNLIANNHFENSNKTEPCKYDIPMKLLKTCKNLDICLHWSQWKTETKTGRRERIIIWKPPEFLKFERKRIMNLCMNNQM